MEIIDPFERWPATAENPNGFSREPVAEISDYKSYSRIKWFRKSPRHYWWRYVMGNKDKDTAAKDEGRLIHKCILETDHFLEHLKVQPSRNDYRDLTKDELVAYGMEQGVEVKKSWSKPVIISAIAAKDPAIKKWLYECALSRFKDDLREKDLVVTADQAERFVEIIKSVQDHPRAPKLVQGGFAEVCAYYRDPEFGVIWRVALDYIRFGKQKIWVTDVKSSKDASPWAFPTDIDKHAYYIQNWLYKRVVRGITGREVNINQLVIEKNAPYCCEVYEHDTRCEETAYWEIGRMMSRWQQCEETSVWPGYTDGKITPIGLPNYAYWRVEQIADQEVQ